MGARVVGMPRLWYWTQVAICVFVLAGMVIAITKLAEPARLCRPSGGG